VENLGREILEVVVPPQVVPMAVVLRLSVEFLEGDEEKVSQIISKVIQVHHL
jgi:hypothetical protein